MISASEPLIVLVTFVVFPIPWSLALSAHFESFDSLHVSSESPAGVSN